MISRYNHGTTSLYHPIIELQLSQQANQSINLAIKDPSK